jgi:hypothetical protein
LPQRNRRRRECNRRPEFVWLNLSGIAGDRNDPAQMGIQLGIQHPLQGGLHQPHQTVEILGRPGLAGLIVDLDQRLLGDFIESTTKDTMDTKDAFYTLHSS